MNLAPLNQQELILVVDDDPINIRVIADYLHQLGFKTITARNGPDGLQQAEITQPQLILLDVLMPDMDGFETCRRLKANINTKHIPVLFMTALAEIENKIKGFAAGGADYITKPFEMVEIAARIKTQLSVLHIQKRVETQNEQLQLEIELRGNIEQALRQSNTELATRVDELASLNVITQTIATITDLPTVLETAAKQIVGLLQAFRVEISLINKAKTERTVVVLYQTEKRQKANMVGRVISIKNDPIYTNHINQGKLLLIAGLQSNPTEASQPSGQQHNPHCLLFIPLRMRGEIIGVITISTSQVGRQFTSSEVGLAETAAGQIAVAIENAGLFEKERRQRRVAESLREVATTLSGSLDLQTVLSKILEQLHHIIHYDNAALFLQDEGYVLLRRGDDLSIEVVDNSMLTNPLLHSGNQKETLIIQDVQRQPSWWQEWLKDSRAEFATRSWMGASLLIGEEAIGALTADSYKVDAYSYEDGEILQLFANQAAMAIHNARLYEQAQQEIAERIKMEEQLQYLAWHDKLTGLPNRALFMERLIQVIEQTQQQPGYQFAALFIDLDRFKNINDSLGHLMGDKLLVVIARRLAECLDSGDMVARLGGDEFVILLDNVQNITTVQQLAAQIQMELSRPVHINGHQFFATASIGITFGDTQYHQPEDVLRDADAAMYQAKTGGRAIYSLFDAERHNQLVERWQLENDLWQAIERDEFCVYYRPIVSLFNNQITGGEAILRWQHYKRGLLEPQTFMELAEETGLIVPIGDLLLRAVVAQLKSWHNTGHTNLRVAINLSSRQLQQPAFTAGLNNILAEVGLPPQAIELEITDKLSVEKENIHILNELQAIGLKISMDDFGVASSLNLLRLLPLNTLKIAPSFVQNIPADTDAQAMVTAIINMAHNLNLHVVVQGVQTEAQLSFLRSQHCDEIQGHFISPPIPAENFTKLLKENQAFAFPINGAVEKPT